MKPFYISLSLIVPLVLSSPSLAAEADHLYARRIATPDDLAANAQAAVADLQEFLQQITGSEFQRSAERGESAIILARADQLDVPAGALATLKDRSSQSFCLWPDNSRLWLVSASDEGLSHATSFYLEHLGVRWYAPTQRWTIVPKRDDIRLFEPITKSPAFLCRGFFGTGGFGGALPCDPERTLQSKWMTWQRRNRFGGEFAFGGHTGEAFNTKHRAVLQAHPEYLAEIDGQRVPWSLTAKWCASNQEVLELYVEDRLAALRLRRKLDPRGPSSRVVSVEPADGGGHCTCAACQKLGSVSDRVFHVANVVAQAVRSEVPDALVNLYAYNEHAAPPRINVADNVFVLAVPYGFQRTDMSPEQLLQAWGNKAKHLGLYDYWSIPDWTLDQPKFDYLQHGPEKLRFWNKIGVQAFSSESTFSTGAMGPAWYISARLAWKPQLDPRRLLDEFCRDCFGPAAEPIERMLVRWTNGYWPTSHELALSFRDVDEALRLAADRPDVVGRVADFGRYVEYLRLRFEYQQAPSRSDEQFEAALRLMAHGWNIYDSTMVHAFRLSQLLARDESARHPEVLARYDGKNSQAPGWLAIKPLSDDEVHTMVAAGVKNYQPQSFMARRYDGKLQPLDRKPEQSSAEFSPVFIPSSSQTLRIATGKDQENFTLRVAAEKEMRVTAYDGEGQTIFQQHVAGDPNWLQQWTELVISLPQAGVYRIYVWSPKRTFRLSFAGNLPTSLEGWVNSQGRPTPRLYFYVPRGIERVAMYASYTAAGPPRFFDPSGTEAKPTFIDNGKLMLLDIPEAHRGGIWSLDKAKCPNEPLRMLNAPDLFAFDPASLLVPSDAVE